MSIRSSTENEIVALLPSYEFFSLFVMPAQAGIQGNEGMEVPAFAWYARMLHMPIRRPDCTCTCIFWGRTKNAEVIRLYNFRTRALHRFSLQTLRLGTEIKDGTMIIDTHFHAFPQKYLKLLPEAKNDIRGTGLHAFDHQRISQCDGQVRHRHRRAVQYRGPDRESCGSRANAPRSFARSPMMNSPTPTQNIPSAFRSFARLPMLDVGDCGRELERCYKELKWTA